MVGFIESEVEFLSVNFGDGFNSEGNEDGANTEAEAGDVLLEVEGRSSEDGPAEFNDSVLGQELKHNDAQEVEVVEELVEDVEVSPSEFSAAQLVEEIHQHECVEKHCVVLFFIYSCLIFFEERDVFINKIVSLSEPPGYTV